jgi:hypothetical protein
MKTSMIKVGIAVWFAWFLACAALAVGAIFVVWHFVSKLW